MLYKEPNTKERRRLLRQNLSYYMQILDPDTLQIVGHLVDVNRIGLMIDSSNPLSVGRDYRLRMDTTPEVADKTCINFVARVRWCRPDKIEPTIFNIGFEITSISAHDLDIIQRIVEVYGTKTKSF
jgi:hypothetical protein